MRLPRAIHYTSGGAPNEPLFEGSTYLAMGCHQYQSLYTAADIQAEHYGYDGEECFVPLTSAMGIYLDASSLAESCRNEISQDIHSGSWNG